MKANWNQTWRNQDDKGKSKTLRSDQTGLLLDNGVTIRYHTTPRRVECLDLPCRHTPAHVLGRHISQPYQEPCSRRRDSWPPGPGGPRHRPWPCGTAKGAMDPLGCTSHAFERCSARQRDVANLCEGLPLSLFLFLRLDLCWSLPKWASAGLLPSSQLLRKYHVSTRSALSSWTLSSAHQR